MSTHAPFSFASVAPHPHLMAQSGIRSPSQHSPYLQPLPTSLQQRLIFLPALPTYLTLRPCKDCLPLSTGPFCCPSKDLQQLVALAHASFLEKYRSFCMSILPPLTVPLRFPPPCHPLSLDLGSRSKGCVTDCDFTEGLGVYHMKELASRHSRNSLASHSVRQ